MNSTHSPNPSILIVDDMLDNINLLGGSLSDDYRILVSTEGKDSIKIAKNEQPDLILLDIVMPGMDGFEVCQKLKEDEETRSIPVIFISAKSSEDSEQQGFSLGAVDYIRKPFSIPIIKSRINTQLLFKQARDNANRLVEERTSELLKAKEKLQEETKKLEDANIALHVLLKRRDREKSELENEFMQNVDNLVRPYLEKLEKVISSEKYKFILQTAIINLNELIDPFKRSHLASIAKLTPAEIQVANFIKMGKTSREIASYLSLSLRTVETHRTNIRRKIGLNNKRVNLRKYLLSNL